MATSKFTNLLKIPPIALFLYITLLAVYYAFVLNFPLLERIYSLAAADNLLLALTVPFVLFFAFLIIFSLLSLPYFFKPFMVFLTLTSAAAFYASYKYDVMFDYDMMQNIFETNTAEATTYLNFSFFSFFVITGIIPALLITFIKIKRPKNILSAFLARLEIFTIGVIGLAFLATFFFKGYASIGRNNTYLNKMINPAHIFNSVKYLNNKYFTEKLAYIEIGTDSKLVAAKNNKPTLVVLVLGETARAQNFPYNGYQRNTTPYTEKLGMIGFKDVASCGTATAISVPCMFSNMPRTQYKHDRANAQDNVLDLLSHAGIQVYWKDNDSSAKGVDKNFESITIENKDDPELCINASCYDEVLLKGLAQHITANTKNKLIALHIIGSHGPTYWLRYPKKLEKFTPSCDRSDLEKCSDEELVNAYDNTLVYTDYFLAQTIALLKKYSDQYNVALMYLSDHGESLGESGFYLHGSPYMIAPIYQRRVPWMLWMPEQYAQAKGIDRQCLKEKAKNKVTGISHDNFFHTLLGFYGVKTTAKEEALDLISDCKI